MAIIKFADAYAQTRSLTQAYKMTAAEPSIDVTAQTVYRWLTDYDANKGFFSPCLWGKNGGVPWLLTAEDVQLECQSWIAKHSPKKGEPNFTALDFKHYLIGDFRLDPATTGYLNSPGPNGEPPICNCDQSAITERH